MAAAAGEEDITAAIAVTDMVIMDTEPPVGITGTVIVGTMGTGVIMAAGIHRFTLEWASVIPPTDITAIRLMDMLTPLPHIPRTVTMQPNHMHRPQPLLAEAPRQP
jgi:hypothetical protein